MTSLYMIFLSHFFWQTKLNAMFIINNVKRKDGAKNNGVNKEERTDFVGGANSKKKAGYKLTRWVGQAKDEWGAGEPKW